MRTQQEDGWIRLTLELHLGPGREKVLSSRVPIDAGPGDVASGRPIGHLIADVLKFADGQVLGDEFQFLVLARSVLMTQLSLPSNAPRSEELRGLVRAAAEMCAADDAPAELESEDEDDDDDRTGGLP
jgi:hypothetical protein